MPTLLRTSLNSIPEDQSVEDDESVCGRSSESEPPTIIWTALLRNNVLLLDIGQEDVPEAVHTLAQLLLEQASNTQNSSHHPSLLSYAGASRTIVDEEKDHNNNCSWTFCVVYHQSTVTSKQAELFLQQQMEWTQPFRRVDPTWKNGGHHCCQVLFGPLLQQRILEFKLGNEESKQTEEDDFDSSDPYHHSLGATKPHYQFVDEDDPSPFAPKLDARDASPSRETEAEPLENPFLLDNNERNEDRVTTYERLPPRMEFLQQPQLEPETEQPSEPTTTSTPQPLVLNSSTDTIDNLDADDLPLVSTPPSERCFCWKTPLKSQIDVMQTTGLESLVPTILPETAQTDTIRDKQ